MAHSIDYFTVPGTQYVQVEGIILADSIGQHIQSKVIKTDCESFPGCKISNLNQKLLNNEITISGFKVIVLIIGTCDISNKYVWKTCLNTGLLPEHTPKAINTIIQDYRSLLTTISNINSEAKIVLCSILPRPFDYTRNKLYLKNLNKELELLSHSFGKCNYLNISKKFIHCGETVDSYFFEDKIHLSPSGNRLLTDILNTIVGQLLK